MERYEDDGEKGERGRRREEGGRGNQEGGPDIKGGIVR